MRIISLIFIFNHLSLGMFLHCYQCNSETHRRCLSEELLIDHFLIECPAPIFNFSGRKIKPFCSKINQWLYFTKKKRMAVIRGCSYYHKYKEKCEMYGDRDSYVSICFCDDDGCNSVKKLTPCIIFFLCTLILTLNIF